MKSLRRPLMLLLVAGSLAACNLTDEFRADESPGVSADYSAGDAAQYFRATAIGDVLTTPDGMTVYAYSKEAAGSPSCYGRCAEHWSAVLAPARAEASGDLTLVDRIDGSKQWAFKDMALYTYDGDNAPGDVKGDKYDEGAWHVVQAVR